MTKIDIVLRKLSAMYEFNKNIKKYKINVQRSNKSSNPAGPLH